MLRLGRRLSVAALIFGFVAAPRLAHAGGTEACVAASERAQELRNAGKLVDARAQLSLCSASDCPKIIQTDCNRWMGEVIASLPSIVPAAKDVNGRDVVEAKCSVDGKIVTDTLDGKAIPIDPGVHVVRFEAAGSEPQEERVVVHSGEQNRIIAVKLAAKKAAPAAKVEQPEGPSKPLPILPLALAAVGVVLLGVALYMDVSTTSDAHNLRSTCAPNCNQGDVDSLKTRYLIAGIGAGVGAAALVAGTVLFFRSSSNSNVGFAITPRNDGAFAQGRISF